MREIDPDPVVEAYKKHVDRTLIRENLKLSAEERLKNSWSCKGLPRKCARRSGHEASAMPDRQTDCCALRRESRLHHRWRSRGHRSHAPPRLTEDLDIIYQRSEESPSPGYPARSHLMSLICAERRLDCHSCGTNRLSEGARTSSSQRRLEPWTSSVRLQAGAIMMSFSQGPSC